MAFRPHIRLVNFGLQYGASLCLEFCCSPSITHVTKLWYTKYVHITILQLPVNDLLSQCRTNILAFDIFKINAEDFSFLTDTPLSNCPLILPCLILPSDLHVWMHNKTLMNKMCFRKIYKLTINDLLSQCGINIPGNLIFSERFVTARYGSHFLTDPNILRAVLWWYCLSSTDAHKWFVVSMWRNDVFSELPIYPLILPLSHITVWPPCLAFCWPTPLLFVDYDELRVFRTPTRGIHRIVLLWHIMPRRWSADAHIWHLSVSQEPILFLESILSRIFNSGHTLFVFLTDINRVTLLVGVASSTHTEM